MSIQDESFPHDELFSELDFSFNNNSQRYQFPNARRHHQQQQQQHQQLQQQLQQHLKILNERNENADATAAATAVSSAAGDSEIATEIALKTSNNSLLSTTSNEDNVSTESANGRPSSVLSGKTTISEPTNYEGDSKKALINADEPAQMLGKASSYHNVHSEYTKRRYRHVQSKVGQYIAQMKAEEEKRKSMVKFQRHRSLPETLIQDQQQQQTNPTSVNANNNNANKRYSSMDLPMHKMDESISDAEANLSEMLTTTPATTSGSSASSTSRHECSDEVHVDFIDKLTYAQLVNEKERIQSYSDYLQTRLDEKMAENMRLKRNLDYLRIELCNCQDKLKRQCSSSGMNSRTGSNLSHLLGASIKHTKTTQTEMQIPSLPAATATPMKLSVLLAHDIFSTPDITPTDANNNNRGYESGAADSDATDNNNSNASKTIRSIATLQQIPLNLSNLIAEQSSQDSAKKSVLRQRLNSAHKQQKPQQQHLTVPNAQSAITYYPSSSDSAIDIESAELGSSPRRQRPRINIGGMEEVAANEFVYYNGHTGRYATLQTRNATNTSPITIITQLSSNDGPLDSDGNNAEMPTPARNCRNATCNRKHKSLRRRWLRFFAPCSRCKELNQTTSVDTCNTVIELSQTQIPLLEKSAE